MKKLMLIPCLLFSLSSMANMHGKHHKSPEEKMAMMQEKITEELKLTKDQRAKLAEVFAAKKAVMAEHKSEKMQLKQEVRAMIEAPKLDKDKFKALMEKKENMMEEKTEDMLQSVYPKLAAFHDSLSAEQRKKASECLEKHDRHMMW